MAIQEDWRTLPKVNLDEPQKDLWKTLPKVTLPKPPEKEPSREIAVTKPDLTTDAGLGYFLKEWGIQTTQAAKRAVKTAGQVAKAGLTGVSAFIGGVVAQPAYGMYRQWKEGFRDVEKPWEFITDAFEKGLPAKEALQKAAYQPTDPTAQKLMTKAMYPFAKYDQAVDWVATHVTSDPELQESVKWLGDAMLLYLPAKGTKMMKSAFKMKKAPSISRLKKTILEEPGIPGKTRKLVEAIPEEPIVGDTPKKIAALNAFEKYYKGVDTELAQMGKPPISKRAKNAYQELKRITVDTSGNIKRDLLHDFGELGREAAIFHDLAKGASKRSQYFVSRSIKEIFSDLPVEQRKMVWQYIQATRNTTVLEYRPKHKFPDVFSIQKDKWLMESLEKKLPGIGERAEAYFDIFREKLLEMLDEGLISKIEHDRLSAHAPYSPTDFIYEIDPHRTVIYKGRKLTVPDSGLEAFKEGSKGLLEYNAEKLLGEYITRIDSRIFRNKANKALANLADGIPDNGIVRRAKIIGTVKSGKNKGKPIFEKTPQGYESISVMENGKLRKLLMPEHMAKEWIMSDPILTRQMANTIGWLSGSKILKPMATGLNPGFALTNFPRDIAHVWITTPEYSNFPPRAALQMGSDLMATMGAAFRRKGPYIDYINEGGGMSFLTHQGKLGKAGKLKGKMGELQDYASYAGETSEIWTRLAVRNRAIKNGKSPYEATWVARNYLDFEQGGSWAKAADAGFPYLNASIQGTRGILRALADRPWETTWKIANIGALSTGLYLANRFINPDCLKAVSEHDQEANFIITSPFHFKDKSGNKKYLFGKIAKDQGQRFFCTAFESLMKKFLGDPVDGGQIYSSLMDAFPIVPTQALPPTVDSLVGYLANKDFWTMEDIWTGPATKVGSDQHKREFDPRYTHPGLVKWGEMTGMSPERTKYALQQVFTSGNIYTSIVGEGTRAILNQMPEKYRDRVTEEIVLSMPFIRRMAEATNPYEPYEKKIQEIGEKAGMDRYHQATQLDVLTDPYYRKLEETGIKDPELRKAAFDYIKAQPAVNQPSLYERFFRYGQLFHLPDKRFWLRLMASNPEARAHVFYVKWKDLDNEGRVKLQKGLGKVPGVFTERFVFEFKTILKKSNLKWAR